jgi:hypothetical protein
MFKDNKTCNNCKFFKKLGQINNWYCNNEDSQISYPYPVEWCEHWEENS